MRVVLLTLGCIALLALSLAAPANSQEDDSAVADAVPPTGLDTMTICEDVAERVPVGEAESFPNSVGTLYCFTRVLTDEAPMQVFHRWYVGDKLVDEIPINVKGGNWRCWSRKTIHDSWDGPCRVEILTEAGDVIGTRDFTLTSTQEAASEG